MKEGDIVYWRFKGTLPYNFGWMTEIDVKKGLYRMGEFRGDHEQGPIVDILDVEVK
jgi:hypothetical protein